MAAATNRPGKSKVGDFDDGVVANKAVACGEVAVNKLWRLQVFHRRADLSRHVKQLRRVVQDLVSVAA